MSNLKYCLNGKHPIPKTDYYCEQCGDNWEGDETGKWAEHYFKKWQETQSHLTAATKTLRLYGDEENWLNTGKPNRENDVFVFENGYQSASDTLKEIGADNE